MAIVIPAPKGSTGWGKDIMSFLLSLHTVKKQTEIEKQRHLIRQRETKVLEEGLPIRRKQAETGRRQVGAYEKQVGIMEKRLPGEELAAEALRQLRVSQASGVAQDTELKRFKYDFIKGLQKGAETKEDYYLGDGASALGSEDLAAMLFPGRRIKEYEGAIQQANYTIKALQAQSQYKDLMYQDIDRQRNWRKMQEGMIDSRVTSVMKSAAPWADKGPVAMGLGRYLRAQLDGRDTSGMETPQQLYSKLQSGVEKLSATVKKDEAAVRKEERVGRKEEIAQRGARVTTDDTEDMEYGSYLEWNALRVSGLTRPEMRSVYLDPKGWGVRTKTDATGVKIPKGKYQRAGYKLMTRKRANELGLLSEWESAGSSMNLGWQGNQQLPYQDALANPNTAISPYSALDEEAKMKGAGR